MLRAQLGLVITSSSALESDHSLIRVWTKVWIWVVAMVWWWSDQNAFGLKSLIRDPLCLESLIRGNLGLESLIGVNFRLESLIRDHFGLESLIRQKFGSGAQPGLWYIAFLLKISSWINQIKATLDLPKHFNIIKEPNVWVVLSTLVSN